MDFELSEDQRLIQETARQFAEASFAPNAEKWDAESIFPEDELRAAAELGFAGAMMWAARG
jgi:alkylation response protein AidB-like acyl-CoA dehydrogenase